MEKNYKEKIKKLLALAQSPNEHEARAALLKARELMAEHKLSEAEIKDVEKQKVKDFIIDGLTCSKRLDPWIIPLSAAIAENYCCSSYRNHKYGKQMQYIGIIGLEDDAEICEAVIRYAVDCVRAHNKETRKEYGSYSYYVRNICDSYGYGFAVGVDDMYKQQQKDNEDGWGLVMIMPQEVKEASGRLGHQPFQARTEDTINGSAYTRGFYDGKKFDPTRRIQEA